MGACGCGDTVPDYKFPGPDGATYAIQVYPSCHYCLTPVGVDIYRFGPDDAAEWTQEVSDLRFDSYDPGASVEARASIPVLDPVKLAGEMRDELDETDLRLALPPAVWATLNDWRRHDRDVR